MLQKCSLWKVFGVFIDEPTKIHYVKEISRKINLAHTSVKKHLEVLKEERLIMKKREERFYGFIANRDNKGFLLYKGIGNIINLRESGLIEFISESISPLAIVLYGSYLRGEDIEGSDIDIFLISKVKKDLKIDKFSKKLKRNIHILIEKDMGKLNQELKVNIINGFVLEGYIE